MAKPKEYTIVKYHRGREYTHTGTIAQLTNAFSYTLECGHSWNYKINTQPKTIRGLINALNASVKETQGSCWDQDYYSLAEED